MARIVTISVKRAWWVMPYVYGVRLFSELTGMEPDMAKVAATIRRGFRGGGDQVSSTESEYFNQEHVHTPDDGKGLRRVFIDGVECSDVTYADTELGIAVMVVEPLQVLPGTDYIDEIVVMGDVRVEPKEAVDE